MTLIWSTTTLNHILVKPPKNGSFETVSDKCILLSSQHHKLVKIDAELTSVSKITCNLLLKYIISRGYRISNGRKIITEIEVIKKNRNFIYL